VLSLIGVCMAGMAKKPVETTKITGASAPLPLREVAVCLIAPLRIHLPGIVAWVTASAGKE
jgi:hypothetical protein